MSQPLFMMNVVFCLFEQNVLKCKKKFYNYIDKSFILAYNNGEKIEGGHHNEV